MSAEMIITMVIMIISAAPLILIGITQFRSREPVGFWSGKEPPRREQITDVRAYNHGHGVMWILYGAGLLLSYGVGLFFGGIAAAAAMVVECLGGLVAMVAYHNHLNRKYML